jgi:hypothetical protein
MPKTGECAARGATGDAGLPAPRERGPSGLRGRWRSDMCVRGAKVVSRLRGASARGPVRDVSIISAGQVGGDVRGGAASARPRAQETRDADVVDDQASAGSVVTRYGGLATRSR